MSDFAKHLQLCCVACVALRRVAVVLHSPEGKCMSQTITTQGHDATELMMMTPLGRWGWSVLEGMTYRAAILITIKEVRHSYH